MTTKLQQQKIMAELKELEHKNLIEVYKDPKCLSIMMDKILNTKDQYYISSDGTVLIKSNRNWIPYHEVSKRDERLRDNFLCGKFAACLLRSWQLEAA